MLKVSFSPYTRRQLSLLHPPPCSRVQKVPELNKQAIPSHCWQCQFCKTSTATDLNIDGGNDLAVLTLAGDYITARNVSALPWDSDLDKTYAESFRHQTGSRGVLDCAKTLNSVKNGSCETECEAKAREWSCGGTRSHECRAAKSEGVHVWRDEPEWDSAVHRSTKGGVPVNLGHSKSSSSSLPFILLAEAVLQIHSTCHSVWLNLSLSFSSAIKKLF